MSSIQQAAVALKSGQLVAFPTETVYGLGADAENPDAVAKIYSVKQRPTDHPLIVHIADKDAAKKWAIEIPQYALQLADTFWPGPMTLILKRSSLAKDFITGGQDTVGLRVPDHPVALELLRSFSQLGGNGVAAPSANLFGRVSPTSAEAVQSEIGSRLSDADLILEGGDSVVGIESTIIDCTQSRPRILRPGAISAEQIMTKTNLSMLDSGERIRVSGAMESHYSPRARVVLNDEAKPGDGLIASAQIATPPQVIRLAAPTTDEEYAQQLYAALRKADQLGIQRVVAITPAGDGIAVAIRDRLRKASS
ncbi:MAG: L-threonylcarbamoyladenylate synthase [Aquiluna sp.]|jgi:L-threonylcarbamoyladenylate synthase